MLPILRTRFGTPTLFESALEPWSDLGRQIDRVFDSVLSDVLPTAFGGETRQVRWIPAVDVEERDDRIRVTFELPGVAPSDVNITIENDFLTVSGEKKTSAEPEPRDGSDGATNGNGATGTHRVRLLERWHGRFARGFTLPKGVDADGITAHYENGLLTLDLPKRAESRRRRIEIGAGSVQPSIASGTTATNDK